MFQIQQSSKTWYACVKRMLSTLHRTNRQPGATITIGSTVDLHSADYIVRPAGAVTDTVSDSVNISGAAVVCFC